MRLFSQWPELPAGCNDQYHWPLGQPGAAVPGPGDPRYWAKPGGNRLDAVGRRRGQGTHIGRVISGTALSPTGQWRLAPRLGDVLCVMADCTGWRAPLWWSRCWRSCLPCRARKVKASKRQTAAVPRRCWGRDLYVWYGTGAGNFTGFGVIATFITLFYDAKGWDGAAFALTPVQLCVCGPIALPERY